MSLFPNSFLNFLAILAVCLTVVLCVFIVVDRGVRRRRDLERLVADMWDCLGRDCGTCFWHEACQDRESCARRFAERLHELDVEVGDD